MNRNIFNIVISFIGIISLGAILASVLFESTIEINTQNIILIYGAIAIAAMALLWISYNNNKSHFDSVDLLILILFIYVMLRNDYLPINNHSYMHIKFLFLLYFGLRVLFRNNALMSFLIVCLSILGIVESVIGLLQLMDICNSNHSIFHITGTFFNPGPFGGYLAVIAAITLPIVVCDYSKIKYLLQSKKDKNKLSVKQKIDIGVYSMVSMASFLVLLIMPFTKSRGAFFALVTSFVIFLVTKKYHKIFFVKKRVVKAVFLLSLIVLCSYVLYYVKRDSAEARLHIWSVSINWNT